MKKTLLVMAAAFSLSVNAQIITTVAGNGTAGSTGDGGQASAAELNGPAGAAFDTQGNMYIADDANDLIRKVNTSGIITTIAGTGTAGFSGDGGAASLAKLNRPVDIVVDAAGNIYIADSQNNRVRKINSSGIITTIAGNGTAGYTGNGGAATAAELNNPFRLILDNAGNLYIADSYNSAIRKVSTAGIITTFAGTSTAGYSGDGGQATAAEINEPTGINVDGMGNFYISDEYNQRIRKVSTSGIITTVVGNGTAGYSGDGGAATSAEISYPLGIAVDNAGNIYIPQRTPNVVRKVTPSGIISTIAGNGTTGFSGDGGQALSAEFNGVAGAALDASGNLYIYDSGNNRIRKIGACSSTPVVSISGTDSVCSGSSTVLTANGAATYIWSGNAGGATTNTVSVSPAVNTTYTVTGTTASCAATATVSVTVNAGSYAQIITTVAGNGTAGSTGDGGQASAAELNGPAGAAFDTQGNMYIADDANDLIRKVNTSGIITTIAGTGTAGFSGDGGAASLAKLNRPVDIVVDAAGNIYIADSQNNRVRKINSSGIITTIAGNGTAGYTGNGGAATAAELNNPFRLILDNAGNLYIADSYNSAIRKVSTAGIITTFAGTSTAGYSGDGGQATAAEINEPTGINVDGMGNFYISDEYNQRIRKVSTSGIITTVVGNGTAGYSGDGGAATSAEISYPLGIAVDNAGNIYIPQRTPNVVRKVTPSGIISTIAGNGTTGFSGDGGPALSAEFNGVVGAALDASSNLYVYDSGNNRIRKIGACSSNNTTNINQTKNNAEGFIIYPNPNNGNFTIEANTIEKQTINIYDVNGKLVLSQTISGKTIIDAGSLNVGVYNINIISNEGAINKRLVIVK